MKDIIYKLQYDPSFYLRFALLVSVLVLGGALYFQYIEGLHPCKLCLYQRYPYVLIIALGLLGQISAVRTYILVFACALLFDINFVIAVYHVGIEQSWWGEIIFCAPESDPQTLDGILQSLKQEYVPCNKVQWSLLGISMAGYNALICLVMALLGYLNFTRDRSLFLKEK